MSLKNFRAYALAVELYRACQAIKAPAYVRDQLLRAALSVACNLGEGSGKSSPKDRARIYSIALGSLREVQVLLELHGNQAASKLADQTGASVYRLVYVLEHSS
jgi:four helix bundle protein